MVSVENKKPSKKWYERYRWFFSSNDKLVVSGKSFRNNQTILKRYTKPEDLVLGSDFSSSIAVIKTENEQLPAETIYEAAVMIASYSKAWEENMENIPVFYVRPDQVLRNEEAKAIEFSGERKFLEKIEPRLSIGVQQLEVFNAKLIFGPPTAVKRHTPYLITIVSGGRSSKDLAREIKKEILLKVPPEIVNKTEEIELKEIEKIIPFGKGELIK